jgi:hypothetical protein
MSTQSKAMITTEAIAMVRNWGRPSLSRNTIVAVS